MEAAKEYTDDIELLSAADKSALKATFGDLSSDTPRTPLAASRFKKLIGKAGPLANATLMKFVEAFATAAAKTMIGS